MTKSVVGSTRPHAASWAEERLHAVLDPWLRARGWTQRVVPYVGYGADGWVRVLARVMFTSPRWRPDRDGDGRGWRRFLCVSAAGIPVDVQVGERSHPVTSVRDGYVDVRVPADLEPGWTSVRLITEGSEPVEAPMRIVAPGPQLGLVSDIDDTVMVTMLPRPLIALRNAFLVKERARTPVPGMPELYADIVQEHPDIVVVYLSTGAWNTAGALGDFLARHGYPAGPLLLTDWGPTQTGWFRSGQEHKRAELRRLFRELPEVCWLLVGDDGQHDPSVYAQAVREAPDQVLGVAIRQLSVTEQLVSTGTPRPKDASAIPEETAPGGVATASDGFGLREELRRRNLLVSATVEDRAADR